MYLSMPSDFSKESIIHYAELNEKYYPKKVIETYGQMTTALITESGRPKEILPNIDMKQLEEYVSFSEKHNIGFNYTLNSSCMSNKDLTVEGGLEIKNFITNLYNIGIKTFTVALPSIIDIIQSMNIKINIVVSTICEVNSAKAASYYNAKGVSRLVLDNDVIRQFYLMKNIILEFKNDVEIIINSTCIKNCPFKMFHYNATAHSNDLRVDRYYKKRCNEVKENDPLELLKTNWIRPEDIHFYEEIGVTHFKVQGRETITRKKPVKTAEYYLKGEYHGNLLELISIFQDNEEHKYYLDNKQLNGFVQSILHSASASCVGNCNSCSLCSNYAERALHKI